MSWCEKVEKNTLQQAINLANHPAVFHHVALMPDCHLGYGMPIGGVIGCLDAVIPNAVGVDIGCGMCAVQTNLKTVETDRNLIVKILNSVKKSVPVGEGHAHRTFQEWDQKNRIPAWLDGHARDLAFKNLGTLGGGNHFIEIQKADDGFIWLMIHSGSRNLGYRIAAYHHKLAIKLCQKNRISLPVTDLAFFKTDSSESKAYLNDMNFAMEYAAENRRRIMSALKAEVSCVLPEVEFKREINIHHNFASLEKHYGKKLWIHRKGATSARKNEYGIIPGSMGTPSYIVQGLGNPESFNSCSHGAGRVMSRREASRTLSKKECDRSMRGIVFDGWSPVKHRHGKREDLLDFGEAPAAYKDIEDVIKSQLDLIEPVVRLKPLGVIKG